VPVVVAVVMAVAVGKAVVMDWGKDWVVVVAVVGDRELETVEVEGKGLD